MPCKDCLYYWNGNPPVDARCAHERPNGEEHECIAFQENEDDYDRTCESCEGTGIGEGGPESMCQPCQGSGMKRPQEAEEPAPDYYDDLPAQWW